MCPFALDKGTKGGSDSCAKRSREGPSLNGIGTVVEKEPDQCWFPGEQNVCERNRLNIGAVGQEQFN
jgi:hypothetical protein